MNKTLVFLILLLLFFIGGCGDHRADVQTQDLADADWSEIEKTAAGSTVQIFMWGGDENINRFMDQWVAPRLQEQYGITLVRTPIDITEVLQKLLAEKQAAGGKNGTTDIIWVNGENFKNARDNGLLGAPFTDQLPNYQAFVDPKDTAYDFGAPTEGLEAPWGKVQFVFLYDAAKVTDPPRSFEELKQWVKNNPGKFTYPEVEDFTGNAFVRHLLYRYAGVENLLQRSYEENLQDQATAEMWAYLKDIKPYLWRKGETYPKTLTQLDHLFSQGEVSFSMGYNEGRAESMMAAGNFPGTTRSFVMESGSIGNIHYLAIPFNAPNRAGAMAAINYLLSPEAQLAKMQPENWGDSTVLDISKLSPEEQQSFRALNRGESVLSSTELKETFQPEVDPEYVNWIKEQWLSEVLAP